MSEPLTLVEDGLMKIPEVAAFLSISRGSVYKLMDSGKLPFMKIGKSRRIPRKCVVEFAAQLLQGGQSGHGVELPRKTVAS